MMADSDWRWLVGGMALLVLYLVGSVATEMGTRFPRWGRSSTANPSRGDRAQSTPPKPKKTS
ncbi:MAG: hypothetical protein EA001_10665 [Oscillatoriales cyanobacterium]|nr:MAG: hypothetical protein EA001_10665 [Oscillatoriales cyanobacterium]